MKQVTIVSKHHPFAVEAGHEALTDFSNRPDVDVMPLADTDFKAQTIGYCAISLEESSKGVYDLGKIVGFATQKDTVEHDGTEYDLIRHLTILPGWQKFGFSELLVGRVTAGLLDAGRDNIAAVVNDASSKAFAKNGFEPVAPILGQTGVTKMLYVYSGGQVKGKQVK